MLPRPQRVRTADEFAVVVRSGRKAGSARLVVHAVAGPAKAGFIVPQAVGSAVVRNRVKRKLRHLMRDRLAGHTVVVRALPRAARADHRALSADLDHCLERAVR